jgi:putative transposase
MLSQRDILSWVQRLKLPPEALPVIQHVRLSVPTRRVGGGRCNVVGRYPSQKMGLTIQFESHRVELAAIYEMEYDADVLEYWDQPPSIKLDYRSPTGRCMGVLHTPDFVIRQNSAGWEEWKAVEDLRKLAEHNPNRYCLDDNGQWRSPPGEEHASELGLYYRVRSSREIDWVFQRNVQFLEDYLHRARL